jgi:hypothetical protein
MCLNLLIGIRHKRRSGISWSDFDEFTDGTTTMRLGVVDGILKLWYTDDGEVINEWQIPT